MGIATRDSNPSLNSSWEGAVRHRLARIPSHFLHRIFVGLLLFTQAGLLAYSATRHSPTYLEPAFLASGISHWQFERFEAYRVNPPLVRMIAALPVIAVGCKTDWSSFQDRPGSRFEFPLGNDFIQANGQSSIPLFFYARWACIPFNLIGAFFAYRWATELYGDASGLVAIILYVFEPNLLAHGELITPDGACTAFGVLAGYTFWRWLRQPNWKRAAIAGATLGLAELTKLSWIILFGLWPLLWCLWRRLEPKHLSNQRPKDQDRVESLDAEPLTAADPTPATPFASSSLSTHTPQPSVVQLAAILFIAIYTINLGYAFDGFGTSLKDFPFVSRMLAGTNESGVSGNRFRDTWLGAVPIPLPQQYVLGFDNQKKDLEGFHEKSYLRGEWKQGGWWYYYLYGLLVKVPCGTWALFSIVLGFRLVHKGRPGLARDELILLSPAITLLAIVSSQTAFNLHLRYVFPALGLILIALAHSALYMLKSRPRLIALSAVLVYSVTSAMCVYPDHLTYFNDFVGGPANGHRHILGSSLDWGQGLQEAITWIKENEPSRRVDFVMWPGSAVQVLFKQPLDSSVGADTSGLHNAELILYSADYFSREQYDASQNPRQPSYDVRKRFKTGMVLVRARTLPASN